MTGFCGLRGFCVTPPTSPVRNIVGSYERTKERKIDGPVAADTPPSVEIAMDVETLAAQIMALFVDYQKTGVVPDCDTEPSPESRLAAAELIAQYTNRTNRRRDNK